MSSPFSPNLNTLPPPTFGVLLTGYLLKQTSRNLTRPWERRFVVLTKMAMHWYRRGQGTDLFGEETGSVNLEDIKSVGGVEETMSRTEFIELFPAATDSQGATATVYSFVVKSSDGFSRTFRCSNIAERERWIEAVTMTIAELQWEKENPPNGDSIANIRRSTLDSMDFAPVGSPHKRPKYLYHSDLGGACYAGSAPPIPAAVSVGTTLIQSSSFNWNEKMVARVTSDSFVKIFLTNAGTASVTAAELLELASSSSEGKIDVTGMRYPGDPSLKARINIGVEVTSDSAPSASLTSSPPLALVAATLALPPILLPHLLPRLPLPSFSETISTSDYFIISAFTAIFMTVLSQLFARIVTKSPQASSYTITLKSYEESAHTASDTPSIPVPTRFINGTKTDPPGTAEKRWNTTMNWRIRENIDAIILQPHPHYTEIKKCYPHFYCRRDLSSTQICYYERPGFLNLPVLTKIGIPTMVKHYNFQIEFCWMYMACSEEARTLSGVDVQNVGLYDIKGVVKEFLGAISKISQDHYPERAGKICVLNAPGWFSMLWNVIKLMLHPNTQKKVFIFSEKDAKSKMKTLIPENSVPVEYGGKLKYSLNDAKTNADFEGPLGEEKESCRWCSEFEVAMADYVDRLNRKDKLPLPCEQAWKREDLCLSKEEYLASYEGGWMETESELHLPMDRWSTERWPGCLFKK